MADLVPMPGDPLNGRTGGGLFNSLSGKFRGEK